VLLWGSWLVVTGLVFSLAQGIIHPYYTVVLAPAIGALVGIGGVWAWRNRGSTLARATAAGALATTAIWAYVLLDRTPTWHPWLRGLVLALGLVAAAAATLPPELVGRGRALSIALVAVALVAALAAPAAYSVETASTSHSGALPTAGPVGASTLGRPGFGGGGPGGARRIGGPGRFGPPPGGQGGLGFGAPPGAGASPPGRQNGLGGLLDASTPSAALVSLLRENASSYTWVAATVGANSAAGVQLATGDPILAIGGFNGTDPTPTLAQFEADVAAGKIHYFLAGGRGGPGGGGGLGGSSSSSEIASWVEAHFTATTTGGVTVYDLTAPTS
jgi:4-amino-4-deoxy-L-arabinose transferase-like glycosyltransferase